MKRTSLSLLPVALFLLIALLFAQPNLAQRRGDRAGSQPRANQPVEGARQDPFGRHAWKAFIDTSGQKPRLRVEGIMSAPTPGHYADLKPANPQGFNPKILLMNVSFKQLPGMWTQVVTDIPAYYSQEVEPTFYDQVTILTEGGPGKTLDIIKPERRQ